MINNYLTPEIQVLSIDLEKGFAASDSEGFYELPDWKFGNNF